MSHPRIREVIIPILVCRMKDKGTCGFFVQKEFYDEAVAAIELVGEEYDLVKVDHITPEMRNCYMYTIEPLLKEGEWLARVTVQ